MKRIINIQNNIYGVVCYLSITILMGSSIFLMIPPTSVNAETKRACQREIEGIIGKLGTKPSPEGYAKAMRYCQEGDKSSAMRVLRADIGASQRKKVSMEGCERKLAQFSKRSGTQPSKKAFSKALRYCQAGDMKNAARILEADRNSGSKENVSKAYCKEELRVFSNRLGVTTSKKAFSKALDYCQKRNREKAQKILTADR